MSEHDAPPETDRRTPQQGTDEKARGERRGAQPSEPVERAVTEPPERR